MQDYNTEDTICALSTPAGLGAIAVIRLSGAEAIDIADAVFSGKKLKDQKANTLHFGKIMDGEIEVDEVVVGIFHGPHSYTGQDIVEISCHGSPFLQNEILNLLLKNGARMAREGEFTMRAFLNGKLDLSQAEAVADLIASDSASSRDLALNQLRGGYSNLLKDLRNQLIQFASMLELELDFAEEDVAFANRDELKELILKIRKAIQSLIQSFEQGNVMKNGVPVAIIGKPNVGKSTLLNSILKEERAIVSDIPGTTRDLIEDDISIGGILFRFIDTAGLRDTEDVVENLGIERARQKAESARIVINLMDATDPDSLVELRESKGQENQLQLMVLNKMDKLDAASSKELHEKLGEKNTTYISAKLGEGVQDLTDRLLEFVNEGKTEGGGIVVSNLRHLEALRHSEEALLRASQGLEADVSSELVAMDIRQALYFLGEITGEVTSDDLLGNIFSKFCIGK